MYCRCLPNTKLSSELWSHLNAESHNYHRKRLRAFTDGLIEAFWVTFRSTGVENLNFLWNTLRAFGERWALFLWWQNWVCSGNSMTLCVPRTIVQASPVPLMFEVAGQGVANGCCHYPALLCVHDAVHKHHSACSTLPQCASHKLYCAQLANGHIHNNLMLFQRCVWTHCIAFYTILYAFIVGKWSALKSNLSHQNYVHI